MMLTEPCAIDGAPGVHSKSFSERSVVQVSGLRFTFDYDLPVGARIIGDVIDLSTGLPIDPEETSSRSYF